LIFLNSTGMVQPSVVNKYSAAEVRENAKKYLMKGQHHSTINEPSGVGNVQALLNSFGYNLDVDKIYGPKTKNALLDYQSKNK